MGSLSKFIRKSNVGYLRLIVEGIRGGIVKKERGGIGDYYIICITMVFIT